MSVFLVHGFRWTRRLVYEHIVNYDIEEASPEWVQTGTPSGDALRESLAHLYPSLMESLDSEDSDIIFVEQHGDADSNAYKQPWIYVCDHVERLESLSLDVGDVASQWDLGDGPTERLVELRNQLEVGTKIGLWVVLCSVDNEAMSVISRNSMAEVPVLSQNEELGPPIPSKDKQKDSTELASTKHATGESHEQIARNGKDRASGQDKPLPTIPPSKSMPAADSDSDSVSSPTPCLWLILTKAGLDTKSQLSIITTQVALPQEKQSESNIKFIRKVRIQEQVEGLKKGTEYGVM
jgi:hypothetical protein